MACAYEHQQSIFWNAAAAARVLAGWDWPIGAMAPSARGEQLVDTWSTFSIPGNLFDCISKFYRGAVAACWTT